jgi:hypothetical protein
MMEDIGVRKRVRSLRRKDEIEERVECARIGAGRWLRSSSSVVYSSSWALVDPEAAYSS